MASKTSSEHVETTRSTRSTRATWNSKVEFVMAALSAAIGLGNLWRFPYQCYQNGGGAFLLPFLLMMAAVGLPQVITDLGISQYGRRGSMTCWDAAPIMAGTGWSILLLTIALNTYYITVVSYCIFYMFASFTSVLPWTSCDNWWNTPQCQDVATTLRKQKCVGGNVTWYNMTCVALNDSESAIYRAITSGANLTNATEVAKPVSPSDEYFHSYVLRLTDGLHDLGTIRWPITLCLILTLVIIFLGLSFGVRTWGKASYVTTLMPYVILVALLIRGGMQEGAAEGIRYFFNPRWEKLASLRVWGDAAVQAYLSLAAGGGILITMGSHNRFHNNCIIDALVVTVCDAMTSLLCGVVIFSMIGHIAHDFGVDIDHVLGHGAGLAFVVYSDILARMPSAPVWSVLFYFMVFCLGLGSLLGAFSVVHGSIIDLFPRVLGKGRRSVVVLSVIVILWYFASAVFTTEGGMYMIQLADAIFSSLMLFAAGAKMMTVGWIYGTNRFLADLAKMTGWKIPRPFGWFYRFVTPTIITTVIVLRLMGAGGIHYGSYIYPPLSIGLAWGVVVITVSFIPGVAIVKVFTTNRHLPVIQRVRALCQPTADWGPRPTDVGEEAGVPLNPIPAPSTVETQT